MSKYKSPDKQFVYEQGKLDLYHEWSDQLEVWSDEADDLGMEDQWQRDSYLYAQTVKFRELYTKLPYIINVLWSYPAGNYPLTTSKLLFMLLSMNQKFTLTDFLNRFPTNDVCIEHIKQLRWGSSITCPKCERVSNFYRVKGRTAYACQFCGSHLYPLAGTIFDKSSTPLTSWFYAIYLMAQTRSGISAKQLERELGVTYKTAWRMFRQIRLLLSDDGDINNLQGTVEVDETYVHPDKTKNSRVVTNGRYFGASQVLFGMVEQGGRARVKHIQSTGRRELTRQIKGNVQAGAKIYSDGFRSYRALPTHGYSHSWVDHQAHQYLVAGVGTQNVENLWSQFKRGMYGVYRHCSPKYLQFYANEYAFRYSHRNTPAAMFDLFLGQVASTKFIRG